LISGAGTIAFRRDQADNQVSRLLHRTVIVL
jgi:hypothetical protein